MSNVIDLASSIEELGILGILALVLIGLTFAVRILYADRKSCEIARLGDAEERAEIRETLGEVKGRLSTLEQVHYEIMVSVTK